MSSSVGHHWIPSVKPHRTKKPDPRWKRQVLGPEPAFEPADGSMEVDTAAAEPPESDSTSAMAIEPDECSDESDSEELDDWEWLRRNDIFSEANFMAPRDSAQPDEWRARREAVERKLKEWEDSPEGIAVNAEVDALLAKSYAADRQSSAVGELELSERTALMFKVSSSGPAASGRLPAAKIVTKEQLLLVWKAIEAVAKDRGKQLTRAYGNFDKLCGLGWLLGDVMCGRLIDGDEAYKIGRRLGKYASGLKAEFDAPLRRWGKRKFDNDQARERDRVAAAAEEAEIRSGIVCIGLEEEADELAAAALAAAARAAAAPEAPASLMPPPPPRPPRPPQPPPQPPAPSERQELHMMLRAAEKAVAHGEGAFAAANRERDQAKAAWEFVLSETRNPRRAAQIPEERRAQWEKQEASRLEAARVRYTAAERAIWPYEKAVREAKFEAEEVRRDLDEYEKEQRRQGRMMAQEFVNEGKWEQIRGSIAANNALHNPGDPEYIALTVEGYTKLHSQWKLM